MPRKEATVVIDAPGRDHGKIFRLTEMSAARGEAWAARVLLALAKGGVDIPENIFDLGMAGIAVVGIRALQGLEWGIAEPLLAEMMTCVQIQPGSNAMVVRALMVDDDIEEVATRVRLRDEVIALHTGFSIGGFISNLRNLSEAQVRAQAAAEKIINPGDDIEMSQSQSEELSLND